MTIDEYIASYPPPVQKLMQQLRKTIHAALPGAEEGISYKIAAFKKEVYVFYFAGYKAHIGLYPAPRVLPKGAEKYLAAKATLRFPLDEPLPLALIAKVVKARAKEAAATRAKKKTSKAAR